VKHQEITPTSISTNPATPPRLDPRGTVLQFDQRDKVRLVAFKNTSSPTDVARTLAEAWISADEF
jgi:hypothetical protein